MRPALVILAAGASLRLGRTKALVEFEGRSVLEHLCRAGAGVDGGRALVVLGGDARRVLAHLPRGCEALVNPDWAAGRSGGLRLAHRARPGRALLVAPVDVPRVPARVFEALAREWDVLGDPPQGWLAPRLVGGAFGHPVVVGSGLLDALEGLSADTPLRALRALAAPLASVGVSDPEILEDLDTPADLEGLRNRRSKRP
ncbi:MAG TPA: NTP transferase domain-containing protein [Planctomycetota bacterium]|nr:NTP transferase domain-containing protein [Planctomycetota bacterium]